MDAARSPVRLVATVCAAEVLTMVGVFAFPALLPAFLADWNLTNAEAGWVAGIPLGAYAAFVPVLVALTDRLDARVIHIAGAGLTAAALAGFALFAEGFWSAFVFRAVAGVGLAATYMPGLRVLVDRYDGPRQGRFVAFYTASFSLGTAASFLVAGEIGAALGWRAAFGVSAVAAAGAVVLIAVLLKPVTPERAEYETRILDFRPIFANREVMGYILAYGAHSWELFAMRAWLVAFLAFSLTLQVSAAGWPKPTTVAMLSGLAAMVSSILGAEVAARFGRRPVIAVVMVVSAALAMFAGFLPALSYGLVAAVMLIYAITIQADSAALTAATVNAAAPGRRGATLGVHAFIGFSGGAMGPIAVGIVLDATGGGLSVMSWGLGFASMGVVALAGPVALYGLGAKNRGRDQ